MDDDDDDDDDDDADADDDDDDELMSSEILTHIYIYIKNT